MHRDKDCIEKRRKLHEYTTTGSASRSSQGKCPNLFLKRQHLVKYNTELLTPLVIQDEKLLASSKRSMKSNVEL